MSKKLTKIVYIALLFTFIITGCRNRTKIKPEVSSTYFPTPPAVEATASPQIENLELDIQYGFPPPTDKVENGQFSILAVGDILMHDSNISAAYVKETDSYDFKPFFQYVKPYIQDADLAIANLECTVAGKDQGYTGYPLFNSPETLLEALKDTGFDVLTTANNHCLDRKKIRLA